MADERRRKSREELLEKAKRRAAEASQRALAMKDYVGIDREMRDHLMRDHLMRDKEGRDHGMGVNEQSHHHHHHHHHHQQQQRRYPDGAGNAGEQGLIDLGLRNSETGLRLGLEVGMGVELGQSGTGLRRDGYDKKMDMLRMAEEKAWQREQEVSHRLHQADIRRQKVRDDMLNRTRKRLAETAERTRAIRDAESHAESVQYHENTQKYLRYY